MLGFTEANSGESCVCDAFHNVQMYSVVTSPSISYVTTQKIEGMPMSTQSLLYTL